MSETVQRAVCPVCGEDVAMRVSTATDRAYFPSHGVNNEGHWGGSEVSNGPMARVGEDAPIPLKLGWANGDCGPESMRLYALDVEGNPRWAKPHARTPETVLRERGAYEGSRWVLFPLYDGRPPMPRPFVLVRRVDHSGLSGTGVVAEGVEFTDGRVALRWVGSPHASTVTWDSLEDVEAIHGHNGDTTVEWLAPESTTAEEAQT